MAGDIWERIDEFPDYHVNEDGEILSERTGRPLRLSRNREGITKVGLVGDDGTQSSRSVALLTANAFVPGRTDLFNAPIHLNGDKSDCRACNLAWRPRWFAVKYHQQFNVREFHELSPYLIDVESGVEYATYYEPCTQFGILFTDIILSAHNNTEVFPTGQFFRFVHQ